MILFHDDTCVQGGIIWLQKNRPQIPGNNFQLQKKSAILWWLLLAPNAAIHQMVEKNQV
jgi:hypothetical protein